MVRVGEMWRLRNGPLTKSVKFYNSQDKISEKKQNKISTYINSKFWRLLKMEEEKWDQRGM